MKATLSFVFVIALASSAAAQDRTDPAANKIPPVQAPPTLDDPGNPAVALPSPQAEAKAAAEESKADGAKPAGQPLPAEVQAAAEASELPVITVRQNGADTVEEYRKHGKLYFVRVLNTSGPPKFYVDNPQAVPANIMQQLSGPSGVVTPVYFNLADWK